MSNLRATDQTTDKIVDKGVTDGNFFYPGTIIAIFCFLAKTVGFFVFFFKKSIKK